MSEKLKALWIMAVAVGLLSSTQSHAAVQCINITTTAERTLQGATRDQAIANATNAAHVAAYTQAIEHCRSIGLDTWGTFNNQATVLNAGPFFASLWFAGVRYTGNYQCAPAIEGCVN